MSLVTADPQRRLAARLAPPAVLAAAVVGAGAGHVAGGTRPVLAMLVPLVLVPVLVWKRPRAGVLLLFAAAVLVEQFPYMVGSRHGALTSRIPFFHSLSAGAGFTPMEVLLALALLVWAMRTLQRGERLVHPTPVSRALLCLCGCAAVFFVIGLARHGSFKPALWELKPLLYMTTMFMLSASLMTTRRAVRALLWTLVLGSGAKAVYGLFIFTTVRHVVPRPDAVLGHEESFFFGLFVMLTLGLWTFGVRGRLRTTATTLLPVVLMADMVNSRRTAWAILFAGTFVMLVVSYARFPARRKVLRRWGIAVAVVLAAYLPLFWNHTGSTAQPARAVRSVVMPSKSDARDSSSDRYRIIEDANLVLNIRSHHGTGNGFGVPIDYAIPIVDLTGMASMLKFVPHDGVYWIWMRMGILGEILFLLVIANGVLTASRLARAVDAESAMLGALVIGALLAYVIMGEKDLGFYWFRMAVCMGVLLGVVDARVRVLLNPPRETECPS